MRILMKRKTKGISTYVPSFFKTSETVSDWSTSIKGFSLGKKLVKTIMNVKYDSDDDDELN